MGQKKRTTSNLSLPFHSPRSFGATPSDGPGDDKLQRLPSVLLFGPHSETPSKGQASGAGVGSLNRMREKERQESIVTGGPEELPEVHKALHLVPRSEAGCRGSRAQPSFLRVPETLGGWFRANMHFPSLLPLKYTFRGFV